MTISSNKKSLRQQLIHGAIGSAIIQIATRILALVLGVVLARGLGAEGYGIYSYAFAFLALMMVVAELGMPTLVLRQIASYHSKEDWPHIRGILLSTLQIAFLSSVILAVIVVFSLYQIDSEIISEQSWAVIFVMILLPFLVITKLITTVIQSLQHVVKAKLVDVVKIIIVTIGLGLLFYFYPEMRTPKYAVVIQLVSTILVLFLAVALLYRYLPQQVRAVPAQYQSRQWLASAIPLTLIGGASIINNQADILMLGYFRTPEEVGIYRVAVQGSALVSFGLQAVNSVIAPQFARLYAQNDLARLQQIVTKSARAILLLAFPIAFVFIFVGGELAGWAFGLEFAQSHSAIAILTAGQLINAAMGSVGFLLNMTGFEKDVARTLFLTAGLNIILNLFLIPLYGMEGAAIATAISLALWNIALYKIVKIRIGINSTAFYFSDYGKEL